MHTIVSDTKSVCIPEGLNDLEAFRRWVHSEGFPENGQICFLNGEIWVDMSKEQFTHNQVKGEYSSVLTRLAKQNQMGRFFPDGYLLTNPAANLSTNPDGMFVSMKTLRTGRAWLVEGVQVGYVELQGTPDMVLEVLSPSSVEKDWETLRDLYWRAGIREYWLVDVRGDQIDFDILRYASKGYVVTREKEGWVKSVVFAKSFRLTQQMDSLGYPEYTLAVR
jgi:Uma2 family endonuclease